MRRALLAVLLPLFLLPLAACSGGDGGGADNPADTLTRRQKDSLISEMPIPGARGVGKAMDAMDDARARAEQHDTIR